MRRLVDKLDRPFSPRTANNTLAAFFVIVGLALLATLTHTYLVPNDSLNRYTPQDPLTSILAGAAAALFIALGLSRFRAVRIRSGAATALSLIALLALLVMLLALLAMIALAVRDRFAN